MTKKEMTSLDTTGVDMTSTETLETDVLSTDTMSRSTLRGERSKRNRRRIVVGVALALVAITAFLLSGTLAAYVTTATGTDTARVARWGVIVDAIEGDGLFSTQYATDDSTFAGTFSVVSSSGDRVIAPGTSGTIGGFVISGTPEVATRISVAVDPSSGLTGWTDVTDAVYEPVLWTLTDGSGATVVNGGTFDELVSALNGISIDMPAGTDLASAVDLGYTISWEWPFTTGPANDVRDTFLADLAVAPTITLAFDVTVTQID